jgi:hypothetical protein
VDECLQSARRMADGQKEPGLFRGPFLHDKTRQNVVPRDSILPLVPPEPFVTRSHSLPVKCYASGLRTSRLAGKCGLARG